MKKKTKKVASKKKVVKKKSNKQSLSRQQRVETFSQAIVEGKTQADAYRLAYPSSLKWTDKAVYNQASELAKTSEVLVRTNELKAEQKMKHNITIEKVIQQLTNTATFNPLLLFDKDGKKLPFHKLPEEVVCALSITETDDGVTWHFKQSDRNKALDKIGDFYQMWSENIVHTGADGGAIRTETTVVHKHMTAEEATKAYKDSMNTLKDTDN